MLTGSTFTTALLRALYSAIVSGAMAGLTAYQRTTKTSDAIVIGLLAALGVLAVRGVGEGAYDASRQSSGSVSSADVQPNPAGKA